MLSGSPDCGSLHTQHRWNNKSSPGSGVPEGVSKDHMGKWILGFIKKMPLTDSTMAELQALKRGLMLSINHNLMQLKLTLTQLT